MESGRESGPTIGSHRHLLALNPQVAAKIEAGERVTAPGGPAGFPAPDTLLTEDCIRPAA